MSDWRNIVGLLAGSISLLGFIPYIFAVCRQTTKPNRASWWIWATLGIIITFSYYAAGARDTIWLPICYAFCQSTIAILSLKYGEGGWNTFDRTCLLGAVGSIFLWWWFKEPLIAITINIAIDTLGALPTIKKTFYEPESEDFFSWSMFLTASTINLCALSQFSVELAAYPLYLFSFNLIMVALMLRPRMRSLLSFNANKRKKRTQN
jgi:hypothetical protein